MKRTTIKWAVITAAALAGGALVGAGTAHAADPNPTIAYVRSGAIYVTSGAKETRLTEDEVNSRPRFSPDGRRIAYVHNATVWVMNADGSGKRQVSDRSAGGPSWSPNGASIAFSALSCTGGPGVYRVSSTQVAPRAEVLFPRSCRTEPLPEVASISSFEVGARPSELADASGVVVGARPSELADASGVVAGARPSELTEKLSVDAAVAWSPDGTKIAFPGGECDSIADACLTVGTVATGAERAIDVYGGGGNGASGFGVVPAWSKDGKKVAWTAYTENAAPVHVEEADASGANRHPFGAAQDREMVYASAHRAVLTATRNGRSTITVLDLRTGKRAAVRTGSQPTVA
jgi:TolB protein